MATTDEVSVTVRLPSDVVAALDKRCEDEERNRSQMIRWMIRRELGQENGHG